jgi:hypothetical protein
MSASRWPSFPVWSLSLLAGWGLWLGQAGAQPLPGSSSSPFGKSVSGSTSLGQSGAQPLPGSSSLGNMSTSGSLGSGSVATDLQVRVFWVVSAPRREDSGKLAEEFKEATGELGRLGIDRPRLLAQVAVVTLPRFPFEMSGGAAFETPCQLSVTGTIADGKA